MPTYTPNDTLLNRYRIEQFVGAGAFAEVYLVTHLALNARYALKILRKDAGIGSTQYADFVQRFRLEARLGAALKSPYIVQVHDFEELDDLLILRMDYAPNGSLQQRIEKVRLKLAPPIPIDEAVRITREVALGLASLHALDAVHRDVKPSNILFSEDGRAMLADLGLAQAPGGPSMRSQMSEAMPHPGTPAYMSPEQARPPFAHLSPPSDIYSLGAVLFEMLTGRLYKNLRPGTPVTKFRKDAPAWLVEALGQMLDKNPEERPWDGEELAEMLEQGAARAEAALRQEQEAAARARREAEEKKRREEAERQRREREAAERRKREEEEKKRREREAARKREEERQRREQEAAERKRRALWRKLQVPETVLVPAGEFIMGSTRKQVDEVIQKCIKRGNSKSDCKRWYECELPQHTVYVDSFEIAKYPVTVAQFEIFVKETGYRTTAEKEGSGWVWTGKWEIRQGADWRHPHGPESDVREKAEHPVTQVSWRDAVAYCQWLSEKTGQTWRLPTEAEWEKAARGRDGRIYPWGNRQPDKSLCNYNMNVKDTTPVGRYPNGASPYGALDMAGNVWEWVADWYDANYYANSPSRNPAGPDSGEYRVLRGGSWFSLDLNLRAAFRGGNNPDFRFDGNGFRCLAPSL